MQFLRQSTASQEVLLGPFLDDTDGKTAETGLTIANTDIQIWKTGATTEANKNSGGATHIAAGRYYAVLDATDSNTIGPLEINVHVSGALPIKLRCCVLDEAVYDALFGTAALITSGTGTDQISLTSGRVDTGKVSGTTQTAGDIFGAVGALNGSASSGDPGTTTTHTQYLKQIINTLEGSAGIPTFPAAAVAANAVSLAEVIRSIDTRLPSALSSGNIKADALAISTDSTAADNLETMLDGTGGQTLKVANLTISSDLTIGGVLTVNLTEFVGTVQFDSGVTFTGAITATNASNNIVGISLTSAYNFAKGTVAMTESYAADGAAPTPVQALFAIQQFQQEKNVSGTTMTIKKIDGTTTAMTFTIDSATSPTTITRTT